MNWNFIIRLVFLLGILGYLISTQLSIILSFVSSTIGMGMVLILFILLTFGIYKFLKAGLKKEPK